MIGDVAQATERIRLGTGVTCPTIRIHPRIVAQAAATSQAMLEGRFFLGLDTGEELNEHVTGARWPGPQERLFGSTRVFVVPSTSAANAAYSRDERVEWFGRLRAFRDALRTLAAGA